MPLEKLKEILRPVLVSAPDRLAFSSEFYRKESVIPSHLPEIFHDFTSFSSNFTLSHPSSSQSKISFSPSNSSFQLLTTVGSFQAELLTFPSAFPYVSGFLFSYS